MTLSRRESLESVTITVVPFFPTLTGSTFLFIYFSIINGLGYDIYLTAVIYLLLRRHVRMDERMINFN